ncbi:MAG: hypothetical protein LH654_14240 [Thermoleophilia bacterium]|nr:hypothetical protein [Thermoleophilia bacterium]
MRTSKYRLAVAGVAALLGGLVIAAAAVADTTFTDATGDATGGAPDITQAVVSNDTAGLITFKVTTAAPLVPGSVLAIDLDTDLSPANGAEYVLLAGLGGAGMLKWDGKDYVDSAASIVMTRAGNVLELKVNRGDLADTSKFGFDVATVLLDESDKILGEDSAPDGGAYTYALTFPQCSNGKDDDGDGRIDADDFGCSSPTDNLESDDPVTLKTGLAKVVPAKPKAGKVAVVSAPVTRVETGVGIPAGTVKGAGRAGATPLKGVGKVAGGRASCAFKLPAGAKEKTVRGSITVTYLGKTKVVPFSFKVN